MEPKLLRRAVIAGGLLAVFGIGLFALLWTVLGSASPFARVLLSVCIPPIVMAAAVGVYFLVVRPAPKQE